MHYVYYNKISEIFVLGSKYFEIIIWTGYTRILDGQGRSCVDQIFTVGQLSENILEKNREMTVACMDLEKAYDKVCRDKLWCVHVLDEYGVNMCWS